MTNDKIKRVIAIDIGGSFIKSALVNSQGKILLSKKIETGNNFGLEVVLNNIVKAIEEVYEKGVSAIGIGLPGLINIEDPSKNILNNIPALNGFDLKKFLESKFGLETKIDNDANNATKGEFLFGEHTKNSKNFMIVVLGAGVGGGLILERKFYKGSNNFSGEIGHTVYIRNGKECTCGKFGCIEAYASATSIRKSALYYKKLNLNTELNNYKNEDIDAKLVFDLVRRKDIYCKYIIEEVADALATCISTAINLLNLDCVVIGGQLSIAGNLLLDPILFYLNRDTIPLSYKNCKVEMSELGNNAGLYGSAILVLPELDKEGIFSQN